MMINCNLVRFEVVEKTTTETMPPPPKTRTAMNIGVPKTTLILCSNYKM